MPSIVKSKLSTMDRLKLNLNEELKILWAKVSAGLTSGKALKHLGLFPPNIGEAIKQNDSGNNRHATMI